MSDEVRLADAIEALRAELQAALEMGTEQRLRFTLSPIELDLRLRTDGQRWHLAAAGEAAHTVRFTVTPGWVTGDEYLPPDRFSISGGVARTDRLPGQ